MSLKSALNIYLEKHLKKVLLAFFVGHLFLSLDLFTESNPITKGSKLFSEKSTRILIPLVLAFPQTLKKGPFPIFILDKNKNIILKKAFLIPQLKQKSDPFFSKEDPALKLVEIPQSKLSKLLPHIGQNLWAFPQIEEKEIYEIDF